MASFLKKTSFNKPEAEASTPKLGTSLGGKSPLKAASLGKLNTTPKPLGGSLLKKKVEPQEIELEAEVKEEKKEEVPAAKPKLGIKKGLSKTLNEKPLTEAQIQSAQEDMVVESMQGASEEEVIKFQEETAPVAEENKPLITEEEDGSLTIHADTVEIKEIPQEEKKTTKKKTSAKRNTKAKEDKVEKQVLNIIEVDETRRVSLEEMDQIMRPIVAPTTALWEQEKKDVLEALNNIKVEQDMNMAQVKSCLSELDELKFEILPKQHDAETMYDGTKQNYDTVKAIAIANGSGTNAEARKAEGILACQNFVTPSGEVVDLHKYMLLIEERYKFYEKIAEGVNFKKYSLVNYNNAIKAEKEGK